MVHFVANVPSRHFVAAQQTVAFGGKSEHGSHASWLMVAHCDGSGRFAPSSLVLSLFYWHTSLLQLLCNPAPIYNPDISPLPTGLKIFTDLATRCHRNTAFCLQNESRFDDGDCNANRF